MNQFFKAATIHWWLSAGDRPRPSEHL